MPAPGTCQYAMSNTLDYHSPAREKKRHDYAFALLSWTALFLAFIYFVFRGPIYPNGNRLWDFSVCASSSYLWVHGQDPFDWELVKKSWIDRGSARGITPDISWLYAIVPPTTLAVLAPFAALPVAIGAYLYLIVTTILTGISAWLCGQWANIRSDNAWRLYIAAILISVPASLGLYSGNPTMLAAPLLLIGSYLIAHWRNKGSQVIGGALIGIGVACKLQLGLPIFALWLLLGRWRASVTAMVVAAIIAGVAVGRLELANVEWLAGWVENVRKMQSAGGLNDYVAAKNPDDLVNLQVGVYRIFQDRAYTQQLTLSLWGVLAVFVLVGLLKSRRRQESTLAAIVCVGLLILMPVYHRTYDAIILLPLLAAVCAGLARNLKWWPGWASLLLLAGLAVPAGLPFYLQKRGLLHIDDHSIVKWSLVIGHKGWCVLVLACIWTTIFLLRSRELDDFHVPDAKDESGGLTAQAG